MLSTCTHCGAQYQLPDKMLGKKARCKACAKLFVLMPAEPEVSLQEIEPPPRGGSTAQMHPVGHDDVSDDPLDALADAAIESNADMAPARSGSYTQAPRGSDGHEGDDEQGHRRPKRMAKGAVGAMAMGIVAAAFALLGVILGIVAMAIAYEQQGAFVMLGIISIILLVISALLGMIAVANGSSAARAVRRARHPIAGKRQASTGTITGGISLAVVFIMLISGGIWLGNNPGATSFTQVVDEQGRPVEVDRDDEDSDTDTDTDEDSDKPTEEEMRAAVDAGAGAAALMISCGVGLFALAAFGFWLWMLIDCCTKQFPNSSDKTMWILVIALVGVLGALIYLIAGRPKAIKKGERRGRHGAHHA